MSNAIVPMNMQEISEIGKVMAASGFFEDARQANQAIVKVLAGRELGFGPFASMTGIHIIKGKPVISANLYASAIRASGRYDYKVIRLDDTGCELAFFENGKEVGRSSFTDKDAKMAGLTKPDSNELVAIYPIAKAAYTPPEIPAELKEAVEGNAQSIHA